MCRKPSLKATAEAIQLMGREGHTLACCVHCSWATAYFAIGTCTRHACPPPRDMWLRARNAPYGATCLAARGSWLA